MRTIGLLDLVTLPSALGCGLVAGAFFAFSMFVMRALALLATILFTIALRVRA